MRHFLLLLMSMAAMVSMMQAQPPPPCDPILNPCPDLPITINANSCGCPTGDCPTVPWQHFEITNAEYFNDSADGSCVFGKPFKTDLSFDYRFCNGVLELCSSTYAYFLSYVGWRDCGSLCRSDYRIELGYALEMMRRRGIVSMPACPSNLPIKWYMCVGCQPDGLCTYSTSRCYMWINVCSDGPVECSACSPSSFAGQSNKLKYELLGVYSFEPCVPPGSGCVPGCRAFYDFLKCFDTMPSP